MSVRIRLFFFNECLQLFASVAHQPQTFPGDFARKPSPHRSELLNGSGLKWKPTVRLFAQRPKSFDRTSLWNVRSILVKCRKLDTLLLKPRNNSFRIMYACHIGPKENFQIGMEASDKGPKPLLKTLIEVRCLIHRRVGNVRNRNITMRINALPHHITLRKFFYWLSSKLFFNAIRSVGVIEVPSGHLG